MKGEIIIRKERNEYKSSFEIPTYKKIKRSRGAKNGNTDEKDIRFTRIVLKNGRNKITAWISSPDVRTLIVIIGRVQSVSNYNTLIFPFRVTTGATSIMKKKGLPVNKADKEIKSFFYITCKVIIH